VSPNFEEDLWGRSLWSRLLGRLASRDHRERLRRSSSNLFFSRSDDLREVGGRGKFHEQVPKQREAIRADALILHVHHHFVEEFVDVGAQRGDFVKGLTIDGGGGNIQLAFRSDFEDRFVYRRKRR
jgi:hypothetical protein